MANPFDQFDTPKAANPFDQFDAKPAVAPEKTSLARRALGDTAVSLGKGVVGAGESAVGLADLATGGLTGKALNRLTGYDPKATKAAMDELYSPEQKAANKAVQEADGFVPTLGALAKNPSAIVQGVAESAPSIIGAGGGAQLLGKAGILAKNALARGALGEGLVGAGQQAEQFRQDNPDGTLSARQEAAALASGAGTAAFAGLGGKVAQKLGIADLDTMLAGGAAPAAAARQGLARRVAEGFVSEGALEEMPQSIWEQGAQNFGNGKALGEGVGNAAATGLVVGGVMGGGTNVMTHQPKAATAAAEQATAQAVVPHAAPSSLAATALQQQILDEQDQMALGINPADGPLSAAASMAVTSGAAKTPTQIALEQQQSELAAQADAAESEIANATGAEDQASNLDWNRFVTQEQNDLADKRDKAAFETERKRAATAGEIRDSAQQMLAEGAYEAEQRRAAQEARNAAEPGIPFERVAPEDYDTLNPIKAGQGELVEEPRQRLPAPEPRRALPQNNNRAPALGFTPQAPEPMRATADGQVGTAQQMEESRAKRQQAAIERVRTLMQGGATLQGRNLVDSSGTVVLPDLNIQQYREARQILANSTQEGGGKVAASQQQEAPKNGSTRSATQEVLSGSPAQGGVDAGGVVDLRADGRGGAGRPDDRAVSGQAAAGVPGAGVGGAGRVKRRGGVVVTDERLLHHADALTSMAHDAGWQEQGGRIIRDGNGNVAGRTKWLPRAEWFQAGMQADPQALAESVRKARAGEAIPSKDQRTISAMMDYLDAQEQGRPLDEDSSAAEWERIGYNEASAQEQAAFDAIDELLDATPLKEADAMRALGFTEDEIRAEIEASSRQGRAGETQASRAQERAADDRAGARDEAGVDFLQSYSEQDLANRAEAERQAAEQRAKDDKQAEDRARADSERDSFTLTGSNRPADVLAAQGQEGLFDQPAIPSAPDESKAAADRIKARILERLGSKPDSEYRGYSDSTVSSWEPVQFTMKRGEWEALRKHAAAASGTKNGTKLTLTVEDVEDKIHDILTVQSVHQTVASMQAMVSRMRTVFDSPANQEAAKKAERDQPGQPPLDHGELNIPGRTSTINAQLDKYKSDQAKEAKAKAKEDAAQTRQDKAEAKSLLAQHQDAILARHGEKFGEKELRNTLDQWAKWEPKKLISFVNKFVAEQGASMADASQDAPKDVRTIAEGTTERERDLRRLSHDVEGPGDVMLGNNKFVTLAQAKEAAQAAIDDGALRPNAPFQYHNILDIAPRDWNRMVEEMTGRGKAQANVTADTPAASPLESLFSDLDSTSTRKANKAKKAAAKHAQAERIEHVQAHFHDLLTQAMDAGNLEVNGVRSLTEETQQCL